MMEIMRIDWKTSSGGWFCKASILIPSTGVVEEQETKRRGAPLGMNQTGLFPQESAFWEISQQTGDVPINCCIYTCRMELGRAGFRLGRGPFVAVMN